MPSETNYLYDYTTCLFYPYSEKNAYDSSGTWPSQGNDVSYETYLEYACSLPPEGKCRGADEKGMPTWIDLPPVIKTKQQKLQELSVKYDEDLFSLQRAWLSAAVADGINEGTRKESIEAEINELKAEYLENRATIEAEG